MTNVVLLEYKELLDKEGVYQNSCFALNRNLGNLQTEFKTLLELYSENIKAKFRLFCNTLLVKGQDKKKLARFKQLVESFKVDFTELKMGTYLSNFESLYEKCFSLKKIISYRSRLELEWAY